MYVRLCETSKDVKRRQRKRQGTRACVCRSVGEERKRARRDQDVEIVFWAPRRSFLLPRGSQCPFVEGKCIGRPGSGLFPHAFPRPLGEPPLFQFPGAGTLFAPVFVRLRSSFPLSSSALESAPTPPFYFLCVPRFCNTFFFFFWRRKANSEECLAVDSQV